MDQRWRGAIAGIVRDGQASGEFGPADIEDFAVTWGALLDGLSIQVALEDPAVDSDPGGGDRDADGGRAARLRLDPAGLTSPRLSPRPPAGLAGGAGLAGAGGVGGDGQGWARGGSGGQWGVLGVGGQGRAGVGREFPSPAVPEPAGSQMKSVADGPAEPKPGSQQLCPLRNAGLPVAASSSTNPSENWSVRKSSGCPLACSGDM